MDMIEISFKCYSLVLLQYQNLSSLLSKPSLEKECFPKEWNNANKVLIHTKGNRQLIEITFPYYHLCIFPVVQNFLTTLTKLNENKTKISESLYQWKTPFNPNVCKLVQEVVYPRK